MVLLKSRKKTCDPDFKQDVLLIQNGIWLVISNVLLDPDWRWKFMILRTIYFGAMAAIRIDLVDNPSTDEADESLTWLALDKLFYDLLSILFCVWSFGCSFL